MMKILRKWYYRRLFFRIYFIYLNRLRNPSAAIDAAYDDIKVIKKVKSLIDKSLIDKS